MQYAKFLLRYSQQCSSNCDIFPLISATQGMYVSSHILFTTMIPETNARITQGPDQCKHPTSSPLLIPAVNSVSYTTSVSAVQLSVLCFVVQNSTTPKKEHQMVGHGWGIITRMCVNRLRWQMWTRSSRGNSRRMCLRAQSCKRLLFIYGICNSIVHVEL